MRFVEGLAGALLISLTLVDIFQSVVVPRASSGWLRFSRHVLRISWSAFRRAGLRTRSGQRRERILGAFGPFVVILLLVVWVTLLIVGFGTLLDALRDQIRPVPPDYWASLYFAGTALLTIGFGDYTAVGIPARFISLAAGATGLGTFALVVTFLFSLFGSFQRREIEVVTLEASAGAPPSGVTFLETYRRAGMIDQLDAAFERWQRWSAEVLDSHLAYPVLAYFRSSHDNDSWISSLGAIMDAATLVLTTIEDGSKGWAKMASWVGGHCIEDLAQYFRLDGEAFVGVEFEEFVQARIRLEAAGYALRPESESWEAFQAKRLTYAGRVNSLARYWASPPAQWVGDRSPLRFRHATSAAVPQDPTRVG